MCPSSDKLEGTVLENVESIKYLGVTITNDLKWNTHISNVCTKANRTLGFLRRYLYSCPPDVKEAAYKGTGAADLGIWKLSLGPSHSCHSWPPGRTGKGPKSCGKVCDGKLCF